MNSPNFKSNTYANKIEHVQNVQNHYLSKYEK